jgi:hypothetical protein
MALGVAGGGAMKITIQITVESDKGQPGVVQEVVHLDRGTLRPETLGLSLAEAQSILAGASCGTRQGSCSGRVPGGQRFRGLQCGR